MLQRDYQFRFYIIAYYSLILYKLKYTKFHFDNNQLEEKLQWHARKSKEVIEKLQNREKDVQINWLT